MKKATARIKLRKDYETQDGKKMVCMRYTAYRRSSLISLNISVHPKKWNSQSLTVRKSVPFANYLNKNIFEIHQKANNIVMENFFNPLPLAEFINKLKDKHYGTSDFYVFIDSELDLLKSSRAKQTLSNYQNLINKMKEWKPTLSFHEITLEYIQRFHDHEIKQGNQLSTIYKKHANFKFLLGLAIDKEFLEKNPYEKFEIKKITKAQNNDILTEDELKILQEAYDSNKYTEGKKEVLREFLFSCYTSLSYAEFHHVTYDDLKPIALTAKQRKPTKEKGKTQTQAEESKEKVYHLLCNERQKTSVMYKIPIVSPIVEQLLEAENKKPFQKIFAPLTNQPTNRYLKEIMKDLKIDKMMTFHRARHSFRTIAAKRGMRDGIAERIMGHAEGNDIRDIYTHLHDEDIVREMVEKWVV